MSEDINDIITKNDDEVDTFIREFLKNFPHSMIQYFDDTPRKKQSLAKVNDHYNPILSRVMQKRGSGVFFSVNGFNSYRTIDKLVKLNALYVDLDVCKMSDNLSEDEIKQRKDIQLQKLADFKIPPHFIIATRHGFQAIWLLTPLENNDNADQKVYKRVLEYFIESLGGDLGAKDIARVLRLPCYYHLKDPNKPFLCELIIDNKALPRLDLYKLHDEIFGSTPPSDPTPTRGPETNENKLGDILTKVAHEKGVSISFRQNSDGSQQIIEDGEITSGFISSRGDFCYSSSGKERKGNAINVVQYYLSCSKDEARYWLDENFPSVEVQKPLKQRIFTVPEAEEVSFTEWSDTIKQRFPELLFPAEALLSVVCQILIKDITNPFALVLVDMPSSGKTITLNFFSGIKGITLATDKFSPASFVSNSANVKKEKLAHIDLLPKLQYKAFMIRDLATIFSKREDDLNECLGVLTRVLDGEGYETDSGVHGHRGYSGEYLFMMIAASTPIPPKVWKMMGNLGSRLFFLNIDSPQKDNATLLNQLLSSSCKTLEKECRDITQKFIYSLWRNNKDGIVWNSEGDDHEALALIPMCAKLLAKLRGVINVWKSGGDNEEYEYSIPIIEKPDRVNQLLFNLARGHAVAQGRLSITKDDIPIILEVVFDSCEYQRSRLLQSLLENNGCLTTAQVTTIMNCCDNTALKLMKTLEVLGLCVFDAVSVGHVGKPESFITIKDEFEWFLNDSCKDLRYNSVRNDADIN